MEDNVEMETELQAPLVEGPTYKEKSVTFFDQSTSSSVSKEILKTNYEVESTERITQPSITLTSSVSVKSNISSKGSKLENIKEVDEKQEIAAESFGWDGYETKFEEPIKIDESFDMPKCIPPWAKTIRSKYGLDTSGSYSDETGESKRHIQEKIEKLMKKHNDLMLIKRVENKKQVILEPDKCYGEMDTVKMRTRNTRYYMTPISTSNVMDLVASKGSKDTVEKAEKLSVSGKDDYDNMSLSKKTSRPQAKREIASILKSLYKPTPQTQSQIHEQDYRARKEQIKCPKITLSKIREYVNAQALDPDERKLHEIIKVEKIPTSGMQDKEKLGSKYIINIPQSKSTDAPTVNIKIKEKHRLRAEDFENIDEKVTELHYQEGSSRRRGSRSKQYIDKESVQMGTGHIIKKKIKSPTEEKTFQVTSKQTPRITSMVEKNEKKTDKVLLIQYEKKSKPREKEAKKGLPVEHTTKLLGVKQDPYEESQEMYMYGSETHGAKRRENVAKVDDIPPTLKDKVNQIFQELREMTFKAAEVTESEAQVCPSVTSRITQKSEQLQVTTDEATVQAMPEVKSAEVQVRQSQLLTESFMTVPNVTPASDYSKNIGKAGLQHDVLEKKLEELKSGPQILEDIPKSSDFTKGEDIKKPDAVDSKEDEDIKKPGTVASKENEDIKKPDAVDSKEDEDMKKPDAVDFKEVEEKQKIDSYEKPGDDDHDITSLKATDKKTDAELKDMEKSDITEKVEKEETLEKEPTELKKEEDLMESAEVDKEEMLGKRQDEQKEIKEIEEKFRDESPERVEDEIAVSTTETELLEKPVEVEKHISIHEQLETAKDKESILRSIESEKSLPGKLMDLKTVVDEDIRSYNLHPFQNVSLKYNSESKFTLDKREIRKHMGWTDDAIYLETHTCPLLVKGLVRTALIRPKDPISFLANWIYKEYQNREAQEEKEVFQEHIELAKTMAEIHKDSVPENQKFNLRKYPIVLPPTAKENLSDTSKENEQKQN